MKCSPLHAVRFLAFSSVSISQPSSALLCICYKKLLFVFIFCLQYDLFSCIYPKCALLPCRVHNGSSVSNKLQWQVLKAIHITSVRFEKKTGDCEYLVLGLTHFPPPLLTHSVPLHHLAALTLLWMSRLKSTALNIPEFRKEKDIIAPSFISGLK